MPLLPHQRDLSPPDLLEVGGGTVPKDTTWVAFYTLARREKDLLRKLGALGIPYYGPLVKKRLKSPGGRTRESFVPLFPGYVFSKVDDDQRRAALATKIVARWMTVGDERLLVEDLRSIKRFIEADVPLTPESKIGAGHLVRVRTGPLQGMEGTVLERRGRHRLVVAVRFLNQGVSAEIEDVDLETR